MCTYSHIPARSGGPSSLLLDSAEAGPGREAPPAETFHIHILLRREGNNGRTETKTRPPTGSELLIVCPTRRRLRTHQSRRRKQVKVQLSPTRLSTSRRRYLRFLFSCGSSELYNLKPEGAAVTAVRPPHSEIMKYSTISEFGGVATLSAPFAGGYFSVIGVEF